MKRNRKRYGVYFYTKNTFQILLWLIEVVAIPSLLVFLSLNVVPINSNALFFDYLERYFAFYAVYQILVFILLKSINDCKKDQLLAINSVYECLELYIETKDFQIKDFIKKFSTRQLDQTIMNSRDVIQEYQGILELVDSDNIENAIVQVRFRLINLRHEIETLSLEWNYSFIVRLFK